MHYFRPNLRAVTACKLIGFALLLFVLLYVPGAQAKDKSLTAVLLFEGPKGPAYLQLSDVMLNGKAEAYVCTKGSSFDNSTYHRMTRMSLANGLELERDAEGALALKTSEGAYCIAPQNLKFDKGAKLSTKDLADRAVLNGSILNRSANAADVNAIPDLKPGFKLFFAPANDTELAEYLRAMHWHTLPLLRMYTLQYANGSHIGEVRQSLATSITSQGESDLKAYVESLKGNAPALDHLHNAKAQADDAIHIVPGFVRAQKLADDIRVQLQDVVSQGRGELKQFQAALAERTAGYQHLQKARARLEDAQKVDAALESVQKLSTDISAEDQKLNQAVDSAQALIAKNQYDQAYNAILRYRVMAPELPKVNAIVDAAFGFRKAAGDQFAKNSQWESAITEYRRAISFKEDAPTSAALKDAEQQLQVEHDKATAAKAVEDAKALANTKQYVEAYEMLASLTPAQRQYVGDAVEELKKPFSQDAVKRADSLTRLHLPIHGRADEDAIRQGYHLLTQVSKLSEDEDVKVKLDLLSDRISDFYMTQARQMFQKPRGSGVGLGWKYLEQAQVYKPDLSAIKDEMTKQAPVYEMRAKLSLGIRFRDQTSRRDSVGFVDQLMDAVSASLETASIPALKLVSLQARPNESTGETASGLDPNFELQCDILQHKVTKKIDTEHVQSHYRAGTREVRNAVWTDMKHELDAAQDAYNRIKEDVVASGKKPKKEVAANLQQMQAKVDELRKKLEQIPETKLEEIIEPYNYTKRTIQITGVVEFAFRLFTSEEAARELTSVKYELPKTATVLENVKPEDTDGVQEEDSPIDETQVMIEAETQAQTELIKQIKEKLQGLSPRILEEARKKATSNDLDAAAERYILYLNCTPGKDSPERTEALGFLGKQYNLAENATGE